MKRFLLPILTFCFAFSLNAATGDSTLEQFRQIQKDRHEKMGWTYREAYVDTMFYAMDTNEDGIADGVEKIEYWEDPSKAERDLEVRRAAKAAAAEAAVAAPKPANPNAKVIADFEADFTYLDIDNGWEYLWNPGGIKMGERHSYKKMEPYPEGLRFVADVNNRPSLDNTLPNAKWLRVSSGDISPGDPASSSADGLDHYVILAYTIQPGEAGTASIRNSRLTRKRDEGSGKFSIYINDHLLGSQELHGVDPSSFDIPLGRLKEGDTVYIAFGPGGSRAVGAFLQYQIVTE